MLRRRTVVSVALALAVTGGAAAAFVLPGDGGTAAVATLPSNAGDVPYGTAAPVATAHPTPAATTPSATPAETPGAERTNAPTADPERPTGAPDRSTPSAKRPEPTPSQTPGPKEWTNYGPRDADSVTVPYEKGRTSWDVTANGIRFVVSVSEGAKAGVPVTWRIEASSAERGCCRLHLQYGDGFSDGDTGCQDFTAARDFTHTYNKPGTHEILLSGGTRERCDEPMGDSYSSVFIPFDVAPGKQTAQGPSLPEVRRLDVSTRPKGHENDPRWTSLFVEAVDEDGWLRRIVVDWGDGTVETFGGDAHECQRTLSGWPAQSYAWLPHDPPPPHEYRTGGRHTITVTVYSTACNGTEEQSGRRSFGYDAG